MKPYQPVHIPESLKKLQEQFGNIVSTPFEFLDQDGNYRMQLEQYSEQVVSLMAPLENLSGAQRIATYNQQYWFRLFTVMQEEFPLLRHLLGILEFNKMVSHYLHEFPSTSPTLRNLSNNIEQFLKQQHRWNTQLNRQAASLDRIYIESFDAKQMPILQASQMDTNQLQKLLTTPLNFQLHWRLFKENWNLVELRLLAADDPDDKIELQPSEHLHYWAIFRNSCKIEIEQLGEIQYNLLMLLSRGLSLEQACNEMIENTDEEDIPFLIENIQYWFTRWSSLGWFSSL